MAYRQVGDVERIAQVEAKQQELAESAAEGVRLPLLGKYQIEPELGAGGGGRVYLAQDELGRKVALKHRKALTPDDQKQVEILLEEARAVASLRHPNVAMVYTTESDPDSGDYSVVMEYADGGALADLLETEGRLSFERALDIGIEVCSALEYVHNQGRIHGDIKPSNILFFHTYGRIDTKIADFGLSRSVQVGEYQPDVQEGLYSGTLEYAAPEMFGGEKVDGRTDLYSLGVVLYEMLVGEPPFPLPPSGDLATVIAGHLHGELRPPKERRPAIFDELDALICRALAKSPSERFQDAQEMLAALQEVRKLCTQYHKQAEELYNQGIRLEGQDRWSEAVSSFEKASALNPELRDVEQRLENARLRLELERTWREMERLLAGEDWAEALEQLGRIGTLDPAYRAEEVEEKTRYVRLQLELASLYGDARAAEGARERQKAIRLYVRIISQDYSYRDATQRLDRLQTEEELEYLWAQGERLTRQESWEEAAEVYEQILEKRPSYPGAAKQLDHAKRKIDLTRLYTQAQTELEEKNWDKAVEILTEIITIEPDYRDAATSFADTLRQQRLGQLYRDVKRTIEQHRWTDAEALLEELLRLQRGGRDARQKVEQQLEYVRQWKNVDELYQQALKKHKARRWDEAIEILENALRVANAAKLDLYDDHKIGLLLTDARLSRQLDTLREKSRAYETDGDLDSLVQVLDQMLELGPTNQEVQEWKHSAERRIHLGDLYNEALSRLDARDWAGARSRLDEIFDIDPEYREVRDKRGQAVINQCVDSARRWGFPLVIVLGGGLLLLLVPGLVAEARKQLGVGSLAATLELAGAVLGVFVLLASLIGLIIPIEILYRLLGRSNRWRAVLALGVLLVTACLSPLLLESVGPRLDPNNLCNGSFEDGLNCWEKGGDLRQTVECEAGQCYAILGSPDYPCWGGVPVGEAWIKQKAKVPQVISPTCLQL
jgi:serine/threonine protein kinase